jgi:hypothetical protein
MRADLHLSDHAIEPARRRSIPLEWILETARHPEDVLPGLRGREVRQKLFRPSLARPAFLVRVIVEPDQNCDTVVTVYRTSKLAKYRFRS